MTTRTKLNITICVMSIMMLLNVFSKPLHILGAFQWALIIGVFVPIGFAFYFIRVQKGEKQARGTENNVSNRLTANPRTEEQKKANNRILLMMAIGCGIGLCAPLWLPLTGTTLGHMGDFVIGLITVAICCLIFGLRLWKISRHR